MPTTNARFQVKRGLSSAVGSASPLVGELLFTTDNGKLLIYTGTSLITINPTYGTAANANLGTSPGNVPVLDASGKFPSSAIPSVALVDTYVVANQSEMLALAADQGDVAVRTDINKNYILKQSPASVLTNWIELATPASPITSVAGKTGVVTLNSSDVGLGSVTNESKTTMFTSPALTGTPTAPTQVSTDNSTKIATTSFVKSIGFIANGDIIDGGTF